MARIHGKNAVAFVKEYKIAGDANKLSLACTIDAVEVTGFGAVAKEFVEGKYSWTAGMEGYWNSAEGQIDPVLSQMIGGGTKVVGVFPQGTTPGNIGFDGYGILTNYSPEVTVDGPVVFSADFAGYSDLYRSTILTAGVKSANGTSPAYNLGTAGLNRGMIGVLRSIGSPYGTCTALIQHAASEAGVYATAGTFTRLTGIAEHQYIKAAAALGPWFRSVHTMTAADSFDLTISCATEE